MRAWGAARVFVLHLQTSLHNKAIRFLPRVRHTHGTFRHVSHCGLLHVRAQTISPANRLERNVSLSLPVSEAVAGRVDSSVAAALSTVVIRPLLKPDSCTPQMTSLGHNNAHILP